MPDNNVFDPYFGNQILEEKSLHGSRKIISKRLMESYHSKIHTSMFKYIEVKKLRLYREKINKDSIIDHFTRAVAMSLSENPGLNATYEDGTYRIYKDINLSIAVDTPKGLVTPVLKKANELSLDDFLSKRKEIIALVLDWKHEMKDILGGTFTISNLGSYEIDFLSPIINPPQVAIMGIGRLCRLNISWTGSELLEARELMPISICYDHSIIDGVGVAQFLKILQDKVNKPESLW